MHDIEPYFRWRDQYIASKDKQSPFYGEQHSEFDYSNKIYNYYIHPQWDNFGSSTLYAKQLFADYGRGYVILELIGEWNDALYNDIMYLKREVIEPMLEAGISKYIVLCGHVLNFHGSDDAYYEEWNEEIRDLDDDAWVVLLDVRQHVEEELQTMRLQQYLHFGDYFNDLSWRKQKPEMVFQAVDALLNNRVFQLPD